LRTVAIPVAQPTVVAGEAVVSTREPVIGSLPSDANLTVTTDATTHPSRPAAAVSVPPAANTGEGLTDDQAVQDPFD
jgi:hypothetical protein